MVAAHYIDCFESEGEPGQIQQHLLPSCHRYGTHEATPTIHALFSSSPSWTSSQQPASQLARCLIPYPPWSPLASGSQLHPLQLILLPSLEQIRVPLSMTW